MKKFVCVLLSGLVIESGAMMNVHAQSPYVEINSGTKMKRVGNYYFKNVDFDGVVYSTTENGTYKKFGNYSAYYVYTNGEKVILRNEESKKLPVIMYDLATKTSKAIKNNTGETALNSHYLYFDKYNGSAAYQYDLDTGKTKLLGKGLYMIKDNAVDDHHIVYGKDNHKGTQVILGTFTSQGVKIVKTKEYFDVGMKTLGKKVFYYGVRTYSSPKKNVLKAKCKFYKINYNGKGKKYLGSSVLTSKAKIYKTKSGKVNMKKTYDPNDIWTIREKNFTYTDAKHKEKSKKFSK